MTFIEAVIAIHNHPRLQLCPNEDEQNGLRDICVYRAGIDFVGKLRWPNALEGIQGSVDDTILEVLEGHDVS